MSTNDTEFYFTNFKRLQYATHIVRRDTGEEIKSFKEIAGIYGYMCDQYESYSKKGLEFFESLESIGLHFHGMDRRTVKKFIDVLNAIGLVNSVKQKQKDYGYDRYHHTVIPLEKIADNLIFYGPEKISGGPLAEGMLIRGLEKKKPRGKPKTKKAAQPKIEESENGVQQQEHEQEPATVASESATDDPQQQSGIQQPDGDSGDDVSASDAVTRKNIVKMPWLERPFDNCRLVPDARRWAQSQGARTWQEEIKLVWKLKGKTNMGEPGEHMRPDDIPAIEPEPAKQQVNAQANEPPLDFDDTIPF
ncbi:DUF6945 domain-containing protein [Pseudocitrobacter faecalis]|uniref:DUF6945 domain-containing protein n=1 Tax=Pseudocitrobacter faecalis TaxID=1398493 RepID=UPI00389A16D6